MELFTAVVVFLTLATYHMGQAFSSEDLNFDNQSHLRATEMCIMYTVLYTSKDLLHLYLASSIFLLFHPFSFYQNIPTWPLCFQAVRRRKLLNLALVLCVDFMLCF